MTDIAAAPGRTIIGEPEVVEDAAVTGTGAHEISAAEIVADPQWAALKTAAEAIRPHQVKDGSIPEQMRTPRPRATWV